MKMLVVTPYFYPKLGGLENYAYKICMALKKYYKWDIVIVTTNHIERKNKKEKINGLKIYRLSPWFKISNTPINLYWIFQIKNIIKKEKPDIINAHTPVPFIADITALVAGKTPFFLTYHALSLFKYNSILFNLIIRVYKIFEYYLFDRANKIILVSNAIKIIIPERFKNKIIVINNSISKSVISKKKSNNLRKSNNLVFISSLEKSHEWKGLNELLLAIKLYKDKTNKEINLHILGDGEYATKYKKLAKDYGIDKNVTFLGNTNGKPKEKILSSTSIGIIYPKSSNDALPTVMLEYWQHSLAIIMAKISPLNSLAKHKSNVFFVEPNNPVLLSEAIETLINNKKLKEKISTGGYKELSKKYILENEIKKYTLLANN